MRFLVTAGSSREMIDRVRDWGNIFTGNTGLSIANALAALGEVDLITSNREHLAAAKNASASSALHLIPFVSHDDLKRAIESSVRQHHYDAIFMTAAVADYEPSGAFQILRREVRTDGEEAWIVRNVHAGKIKSSYAQIAFVGQPTEKLIDLFRTTLKYDGLLVKFKLEVGVPVDQLIQIGQASRRASQADYLVANTLEMVSGENAGAYLLSDAGHEWIARSDLPKRMAQLVFDQQSKIG
jgi:phosphopantothenate---cysteine ligase (CTP)